MDFRLSSEQQGLQHRCRDLAADFATRSAANDRDASHPSENCDRLREEGFLALTIGKEWGGCYDDGNGGHCLVGALLHLGRKHGLPTRSAIALLQDAMPRPGLPLVHFNDSRCGSVAELRSVILKARRLAHDHAERERAAAEVKAWLLAQIEKKRTAASAEPFVPDRLAA